MRVRWGLEPRGLRCRPGGWRQGRVGFRGGEGLVRARRRAFQILIVIGGGILKVNCTVFHNNTSKGYSRIKKGG
jgi:hypothetical protein